MQLIDLGKLNEMLNALIEYNKADIKHAAENEWYDKAANLSMRNEGINKAKIIANSGDCLVVNKSRTLSDFVLSTSKLLATTDPDNARSVGAGDALQDSGKLVVNEQVDAKTV